MSYCSNTISEDFLLDHKYTQPALDEVTIRQSIGDSILHIVYLPCSESLTTTNKIPSAIAFMLVATRSPSPSPSTPSDAVKMESLYKW